MGISTEYQLISFIPEGNPVARLQTYPEPVEVEQNGVLLPLFQPASLHESRFLRILVDIAVVDVHPEMLREIAQSAQQVETCAALYPSRPDI